MATVIGIWLAALLTLAIFSFLYGDNPFYKAAELLYVGVSAAFWLLYIWSFTVAPNLLVGIQKQGLLGKDLLLIPLVLGILMLFRIVPKYAWYSRYPMAFAVGLGAGLALTGTTQGLLFPQIQATILHPFHSINNFLLILGVITSLLYFYFSREREGVMGWVARIGIYFIMIAFGATFGYTVMARVSLLIGRVGFLLSDWLHLM